MVKGKKIKRKEKKPATDNDKKEKTEENDASAKEPEERHGTTVISFFKKDELQEIRSKLNVKVLTDNDMLLGAVALGKFDVVKRLLKQGSPINYIGTDNMTSLMWAVKCKRLEMMDLLIRRGADVSAVDSDGNNALLIAIQSNDWDQDTFLDFWHSVHDANNNILLNQANKTGNTVLHYAVKRQWDNVLEEFIEVGADVNCVTAKGVTPLMMAGSRDDSKIVSKLLYAKADISHEDQRGCTALCYAISYMIQKRLESPNPSLQQFLERINDPSSSLTLEIYLKRRLDLLVYPPEENFSSTINSLITHIVTFFVRYIQAGLELLLELQVFVRVREATERHVEDIEYVLALLAVTLELVRSCKCCIGETAQQKIVKSFINAGVPETCLNILKKHGLAPLSNNILNAALIPIMAVCTTDNSLGKLWLQKNFTQVQPFYQKYYRTCIINFNILADDYHIRLLKRNIKEFQTLMQRIECGDIIAEETQPEIKKKKFIEEVKIQPLPLRKENSQPSVRSLEIDKIKASLTNSVEEEDKAIKSDSTTNNCIASCKISNENNLHRNKINSVIKPQKMSITLQDEYGKVYCKRENSLNKFKPSNNSDDILYIPKLEENYYANGRGRNEICPSTKIYEKNNDDPKITKILQPNRLKQGETFSSVLQQSLNKEKCVTPVLKNTGNSSQHMNNSGTGDGLMNKSSQIRDKYVNDNFKMVLNVNNGEESYNKRNQTDTVINEAIDNYQKRINKLKSVFVANTHINTAKTSSNFNYNGSNSNNNNNDDEDVIIESEYEENLSQKSSMGKNISENDLVVDSNSMLISPRKTYIENVNEEDACNEILVYEKLLNDVIDEYGAGGDINKDVTDGNMTILSNSSSTLYITSDECEKMIICIDKFIKKIVNHYEILWKNDWESGYINATCGPQVLLELMTKLPYYERIHLQRLIDIWNVLKDILINKTKENCKIKKDVFKKLYNYLKNYAVKLEVEVSNTINLDETGWYDIDMTMQKGIVDFLEKDESIDKDLNANLNSSINNEHNGKNNKSETIGNQNEEIVKMHQENFKSLNIDEQNKIIGEISDDDNHDIEDYEDAKNDIVDEIRDIIELQPLQQKDEICMKGGKTSSLEKQLDECFKKELSRNDEIINSDYTLNDEENYFRKNITEENSAKKNITEEENSNEKNVREEKYHESKWIWNNGEDSYVLRNSKSMGVFNSCEENMNDNFIVSESNNSLKTLKKHETMTATKTATIHSVSYRAILKHYSNEDEQISSSVNQSSYEKSNNCYRAILKRNDNLRTNCSLPSLSSLTPSASISSLSLPSPPPGFPLQPAQQLQNNAEPIKWKLPVSNKDRKLMYSSVRHLEQISKLRAMTPLRCQSFDSGALTVASQSTYPEFKLFNGGNFGAVELGLDSEGYPLAVKRFTLFNTKGTKLTGTLLKSLLNNMLDLHHWSIVPYSTCVDAEEQILIATPLCERNLVEYIAYLKETDSLQANALHMVKQVFEGLHYLHSLEKPIIHGNLKPTNILVDAESNLRLADFGLHKVLYKQMCPLGTAAIWWAQETYYVYQATWQMVCTLKSDIQVAGMLMHYILTGGLHPFGGDSPSILENLLAGIPALHTTISCDVNDLLSWMLVHSPLDRPNIGIVLRHICFWPKNRKWDFILSCSGLTRDKTKSILPLNEFFSFINRRAYEEKSSGDWVSIINENFPALLSHAVFDAKNPSGLLQFINYCVTTTNLHEELKDFFLQAFPNLALCLYRLIEDSTWQTHPALIEFTSWVPSRL